jgi:hypothetical protein
MVVQANRRQLLVQQQHMPVAVEAERIRAELLVPVAQEAVVQVQLVILRQPQALMDSAVVAVEAATCRLALTGARAALASLSCDISTLQQPPVVSAECQWEAPMQ